MRRKGALPELLAPAGSFECLVAAVAAGADAVYVGGRRFGARAFAKNFAIEELERAVAYCHLHGVRLYVTLNTLIEDKEMADAVCYAAELWRIGVDAVIISDLGVLSEVRRNVPGLELHASTQMSVHNTPGADEAFGLGCVRVVPARELTLENIKSMVESSSAEVEIFLHGALCVCHSGQCLFSSLVGGRSGNRGECAQPCRLPYKSTRGSDYPLSLKDLSLSNHIPEIIESGVASLKIEGRMKSPHYVYTVTSIYRRLLDEGRPATAAEDEILRRTFSRDGFTDGYLTGRLEGAMTGVRSEEDKRDSHDGESSGFEIMRHGVRAKARILAGIPAEMTVYDGKRSVTVFGEIPSAAQSSPLDADGVRARLSKMGNTFLSLPCEDIEVQLDPGLNLSPAALNGLRRAAAEAFENFGREAVDLSDYSYHISSARRAEVTSAEFYSGEEFVLAKNIAPDEIDRLDYRFVPLFSSDDALRAAGGVMLPPVITDGEIPSVKKRLAEAEELGVSLVLVGNIGHIGLLKGSSLKPVGGFRLNVFNRATGEAYKALGVDSVVLSPELTLPQARDISGSAITYGRIPLMLTERCFIKDNFGCSECGSAALVDRRGEAFPMIREWGHRNQILNSAVTYMGDRRKQLLENDVTSMHLIFTVESGAEIASVLRAHRLGDPLSTTAPIRRMGKRDAEVKRDSGASASVDARSPLKSSGGSKNRMSTNQTGRRQSAEAGVPSGAAKRRPLGKKVNKKARSKGKR